MERRHDDTGRALVFEGRSWQWSEVVAESIDRGRALLPMRRPDTPFHIGVLLENVPEFVFLLLGASLAGATLVGINPTRRGDELAADIRHTDCQIVITDDRAAELSRLDLGAATGRVIAVESSEYATAARSGQLLGHPSPEDLYLLLFTSGSTGSPKAVRMSHGRAARQAAESARAFVPSDVLYCAMPLFHGNALIANLFPALVAGSSVVLRRRFSASGFGPDIREHGCTYFNYVGRALAYIVAVPESPQDGENSLKWALGSEASPQTIADFSRRYGCPVFEGYGSSENAVIIRPAPGMPPGSLGKPKRGTDVAIVDSATGVERAVGVMDAEGRLLNPDESIGEIVGLNTVGAFEGYYRNPEADAQRTRDGWYWSGDLGYRDAEGWVYFAGRTADWLRVDGENFSAGAVERILDRYPGASGVAVYGVPDPVTGDQVMMAVEMEHAFNAETFGAFVDSQPDLGTKWAPRFVRVTAALPVTATRKVDKAVLRAERWDVDDAVWWREDQASPYRTMTETDRLRLREQFEVNGRGALLDR